MKRFMYTLALFCLLSSPAFAFDYNIAPTDDAFSDSFYFNRTAGYLYDDAGHLLLDNGNPIPSDRLWAGATVNYTASPEVIDNTEFARTYLKFDITPVKTSIDKAVLWLYRVKDPWTYNDPDAGNVTVYRQLSGNWDEETLKWKNAPAFNSNTTDQGPTVYINELNGGWVAWDVSTFAKQSQGGNFSLVLSTAAPFHIFESKETLNGHAPFLGINVVPEPISFLLFGIGGLTLAARRKIGRRKS